ncbi:hypothetical protein TNCV_2341921 [Trichonephila clavipes]|uniref:Uncharacterized protein n=1 Tax=Trichonephila clavipes TaxID=2585209 RepID=A0A8X6R0I9_TRICX|nr:hypothetical protein TNCV_2341921 [Trichonephila clavipes]
MSAKNATSAMKLFAFSTKILGSPVVKVSDHGRHVVSTSPVPLKTRHWLDSPRWTFAFSRSPFQARHLLASVLQFLVVKARRSFSRPSKIRSALSS